MGRGGVLQRQGYLVFGAAAEEVRARSGEEGGRAGDKGSERGDGRGGVRGLVAGYPYAPLLPLASYT